MISRPIATVFAVLLVLASAAGAQTRSYPVQTVKAAFLYRFVDYAEWPVGRSPDRALTIAVLGDDGVAEALERSVQARKSPERAITVLNIEQLELARGPA